MTDGRRHHPRRDYLDALSNVFARIGEWSYDHRWIVVGLCVALVTASAGLASTARIDMTFEAFFDDHDPTYGAYRELREDFGSDELSYILYEAPGREHGPFDLEVMRQIARLTEAIEEEVPFVEEVTSLTNVELMEGIPDGVAVYALIDDFPATQSELLSVREKVLKKPLLVGALVSPDASYAAIIVRMEKSAVDPPEELMLDPDGGSGLDNLYPQVSDAAVSAILARPEYADIVFHHTGWVPWNATFNRTMIPEMFRLMGISYVLVGLLLYGFSRRIIGVVGPFLVVTISITMSAGLVGLLGWKIDLMFPFVPNLLIAVGVADSVHIISEFRKHLARLHDRRAAVRQTLRLVGAPCLLTSLTTAGGLLAMSASHVQSLAHMAIYSAVGVLGAFLLSITLLLTFVAFGRRSVSASGAAESAAVDDESEVGERRGSETKRPPFAVVLATISRLNLCYPRPILFAWIVVFVVSILGIRHLRIDTNFLDEWKEDAPIKQLTLKVDGIMGGMTSATYLFDTGVEGGIQEPAVLHEIERLQAEADRHGDYVKKSYSIVDLIKDINQSFHDGDPAYYKIPATRELVAQYLLIYEMSGGGEIEEYVSGDFARANLELRCRMDAISRMQSLAASLDAYLAAHPLEASQARFTGIGALWVMFSQYVLDSQIRGISLAFAAITVMMCTIFRSVKVGLLSMIPNLCPVLLGLGYMGWNGMNLDYSRVLLAPLAIGIAVDDTIHFLTRYHAEFRRSGDYARALEDSLHGVGRPLIVTTIILVTGFLVNVFHSMEIQVVFGKLIALMIGSALAADLFLMPALILITRPFGPERTLGENRP